MIGKDSQGKIRNTRSIIQSELRQIIKNSVQSENGDIKIRKGINGQGVFILIDNVRIAIDHWDLSAEILFVSHAHMDHIPQKGFKKGEISIRDNRFPYVICSKITRELMTYRTKGKFSFNNESWLINGHTKNPISIDYKGLKFTILENGHAFGSNSLLIEGTKTIFYTSEFIIERRTLFGGININELKPQSCDYLIIDATFGKPFYKFPSFNEIYTLTNKTINQYFQCGLSVILLGYSYGKSQLLLGMLNNDFKIYIGKDIGDIVKILEKNDIVFPNYKIYFKETKKELEAGSNFLFITSPTELSKNPILSLINSG